MRRHPKVPELHDSARPPKVGRIRRAWRWQLGSTRLRGIPTVLLAVVIVAAVYLLVIPAPAASIPQAVVQDRAGATPSVAAPDAIKVECKAQTPVAVVPETLVLTTYSTQWYPMGTMLAPQSKTGGPGNAPAHQCFSRTPEGALYAAATRVAQEAAKGGVSGAQFSGYQWLSYSPDLATVSIAARPVNGTGGGSITSRTFSTRWVGNDWQVSVLDQPVEKLDGLRTFTPWGGA